jgi:hypothetical protein
MRTIEEYAEQIERMAATGSRANAVLALVDTAVQWERGDDTVKLEAVRRIIAANESLVSAKPRVI